MTVSFKTVSCLLICLTLTTNLVFSQGIYSKTGSSVVAKGSVYLVIQNGGFQNDGSFIKGNSTVVFSGNNSSSGSFIAGESATTFNNLTLNKTSNGLQLNSDIAVAGMLSFQSGDSIYLNNHVLDLGSSGTISGESNGSRFTGLNGGYIMLNRSLLAPVGVNPGNIGVTITSVSNLGNTVIKRYQTIQKGKSVSRSYEILPSNNFSLAATLVFSYFHSELNGITESSLASYSSTNSGSTWSQVPNTSLNTTTNTLNSVGLNSFNFYTLFRSGADLPVKLLYFKGELINQSSLLSWATTSETGNDHFEIERSASGIHFTTIGHVAGAGNSTVDQIYSFTDRQLLPGVNYYRLKQVDQDGKCNYSEILMLKNKAMQELLSVSPNPASLHLNLKLTAEKDGDVLLMIVNASGITYKTTQLHLRGGVNLVSLPVYDLSKGVYFIQTIGCMNESTRFVKD